MYIFACFDDCHDMNAKQKKNDNDKKNLSRHVRVPDVISNANSYISTIHWFIVLLHRNFISESIPMLERIENDGQQKQTNQTKNT